MGVEGVINGQFVVGRENADERSGAVCFPGDNSPGLHYLLGGDVADDHREGGFMGAMVIVGLFAAT
jgi:hypothetical protein